jgi:hypothetical protein
MLTLTLTLMLTCITKCNPTPTHTIRYEEDEAMEKFSSFHLVMYVLFVDHNNNNIISFKDHTEC